MAARSSLNLTLYRQANFNLIVFLLTYCLLNIVIKIDCRQESDACTQDVLDRSFVTKCDSNYCEPVIEHATNDDWPSSTNTVVQIQSTRQGDRFKMIKHQSIDTSEYFYEESHVNGTIFVDTKTRYQRILGFGTTLTDSSCTNVDDLPDDIRNKLIRDYFSTDDGIGLNLIKVPIGSTKYSYSNYALDQSDLSQVELSPYDIDYRIPLIREAQKAAGRYKNRIKIIASSLTAPQSYKQNNKLSEGGRLKTDRFDNYASYLNSFVRAFKEKDLNTWALIIGENSASAIRIQRSNITRLDYSSMSMSPMEVIELIQSISKARERQTNQIDRYRLLILGDNRSNIPNWSNAIFDNPQVKDKVAGIAYTCDLDDFAPYDNLEYSIKRYPTKYLLACQSSSHTPVKLGNWQYAEDYATEIVKNLAFGSVGWIDFNMALDLSGGPSINSHYTGKFDYRYRFLLLEKQSLISPIIII